MKTSSLFQGLALSLLALSLQACLSPDSVVCESGLLCPPGHSCSADQKSCISNSCGNGRVEPEFGEVCDDGNVKSLDGCSADCSSTEKCGNGTIDTAAGEKCDDGNEVSGDGCSADCKSDESCGNGVVDQGEMCDTGMTTLAPGQRCSADCKSDLRCGNGILDPGEVCDDKNNVNGDGCSADCQSKESCGNHVRDGDEECDEGPKDTETCVNCHIPRCGDGLVQGKEQCDSGGKESSDCNLDCTKTRCGDGIVNKTAGEECDGGGGHAVDTESCTHLCRFSRCGDGVVNTAAGEECDSTDTHGGQAVDTNTCTHECKKSWCGDGYRNVAAGEQCDDGNTNACGTCDATCTKPQIPDLAVGTITAVSGDEIASGEYFNLSDGVFQLTFAFQKDSTGKVPNGSTVVAIKSGMSAAKVAEAIRDAIQSDKSLAIEPTLNGVTVMLENTSRWRSNIDREQRIDWTVKSPDFKATGMKIEAEACTANERCVSGMDCQSGHCESGVCKQ